MKLLKMIFIATLAIFTGNTGHTAPVPNVAIYSLQGEEMTRRWEIPFPTVMQCGLSYRGFDVEETTRFMGIHRAETPHSWKNNRNVLNSLKESPELCC